MNELTQQEHDADLDMPTEHNWITTDVIPGFIIDDKFYHLVDDRMMVTSIMDLWDDAYGVAEPATHKELAFMRMAFRYGGATAAKMVLFFENGVEVGMTIVPE